MKERGYKVHITSDSVSVEHRASFRPRTLVVLALAYVAYWLLPPIREVLLNGLKTEDLGGLLFFLLLGHIPLLGAISWLLFASGEVMRCDNRELHFARRRSWGRWHRFHFPNNQLSGLHRASRGGNKNRVYTVLTFQANGRRYDMLEDLPTRDGDAVLSMCKALGVDVTLVVNPGAAMIQDIEERGWWVNPLHEDNH